MQGGEASAQRSRKGEVGSVSQVQLEPSSNSLQGTPPLLEVSNLNVRFTKTRGTLRRQVFNIKAVDDVSFKLEESDVISLVGESGSGKTTLARCIMGLIPPTSGSIKFNGVEVTMLKGEALLNYRHEAQIIFQDPFETLNPGQDVFGALSAPIRHLTKESDPKKIRDKIWGLLEEIGLDPNEVVHRFPHQLSGGQRQRINIARALATDPKLLIADEPITMLDAAQRKNILSLLTDLKATRNLTILMITHDLASAKVMSQRTMVMYLGKIVETGPTEKILAAPYHPYVELILSATPRLKHRRQALERKTPIAWLEQSELVTQGCIFRPRCKYAADLCREKEPELLERSAGHLAACHFPLNESSD
jgi:oligopeptide/dipeptide ABC transporter ATP-binding protein